MITGKRKKRARPAQEKFHLSLFLPFFPFFETRPFDPSSLPRLTSSRLPRHSVYNSRRCNFPVWTKQSRRYPGSSSCYSVRLNRICSPEDVKRVRALSDPRVVLVDNRCGRLQKHFLAYGIILLLLPSEAFAAVHGHCA